MIIKAIASTTHIDAHQMKMTKEALESAAKDINSGRYACSVGVEHDLSIMPIGKVTKAYVDKFDDEEYALYIEQEIFDKSYKINVNDEEYILTRSEIDDRPFALDTPLTNDKLTISADPVNFDNNAMMDEFFSNLATNFDFDSKQIIRKSVIPDPELIFELIQDSMRYLFIYLASKKAIERFGDALIDKAATESHKLYAVIKNTLKLGASYLHPKTRPVTYVFKGYWNCLIELIIKTSNPDEAISVIGKSALIDVFEKTQTIHETFPNAVKIQFVYNTVEGRWDFNFLTTECGEVIGTEKSYSRSAKQANIQLGISDETATSVSITDISG